METIHMADIIPLLPSEAPPWGKSSYYVQCPCCDESPRKKHLNIDLRKNVFRCPRCGVSGGIFDLYALFSDVPRDIVREEIIGKLGISERSNRKTVKEKTQPQIICPLMDIESRHATYTAFLSKLSLATDHRKNLECRGLNEAEIESYGYKTTPLVGVELLARQLREEGLYLAGVPGFYKDKTGSWTFVQPKRGILIPVRDRYGRIQGLQLRQDNVEKRKFRWISSASFKDGCPAEGWTHLAGPVTSSIILTEGPMKADVIHALTGRTVLAVPGVNTLTQLKITLSDLWGEGLREIKTAFDMDFIVNQHVQNGYHCLLSLLDEMGFCYGTYLWDSRYKGLDDYIWENCMQKERSEMKNDIEAKEE